MRENQRQPDAAGIINAAANRQADYQQVKKRVLDAAGADEIAQVRAGTSGILDALGDKADKYDITKQTPQEEVSFDYKEALDVAGNPDADANILHRLATTSQQETVLVRLAGNPAISSATVEHFINSNNPMVLVELAGNQATQSEMLTKLWERNNILSGRALDSFAAAIAKRTQDSELLLRIANEFGKRFEPSRGVNSQEAEYAVASNPNSPKAALDKCRSVFGHIQNAVRNHPNNQAAA